MEDLPILGDGEDRALLKELMAQSGAPAFVVRAAHVQEAYEVLVRACRRRREEWLALVRTRLATVKALAADWETLGPYLADEDQLRTLQDLHASLEPRLRVHVEPTSSGRALRRALAELNESIERFNQRWREHVRTVDLTRVNDLRDGYNKYYVLEKECVVRLPRLARQGFEPLPPVTAAELFALLPPLPVPRLRG